MEDDNLDAEEGAEDEEYDIEGEEGDDYEEEVSCLFAIFCGIWKVKSNLEVNKGHVNYGTSWTILGTSK